MYVCTVACHSINDCDISTSRYGCDGEPNCLFPVRSFLQSGNRHNIWLVAQQLQDYVHQGEESRELGLRLAGTELFKGEPSVLLLIAFSSATKRRCNGADWWRLILVCMIFHWICVTVNWDCSQVMCDFSDSWFLRIFHCCGMLVNLLVTLQSAGERCVCCSNINSWRSRRFWTIVSDAIYWSSLTICGLLQGTGINRGGLYIKNVQFYHAGQYRCVVKSTTDEIMQSAMLTVIGMTQARRL